MGFCIRKVKDSESDMLDSLFSKLLENERINYDENIKSGLTMKGFFEKRVSNSESVILVAEVNNKIVGYIYGYINYDNNIKINLEAYIDSLYVEEEYRNNKIGTELINTFIREVKKHNAKYVYIENKYLNKGAKQLYEKMGFDIFIQNRKKEI